MGALGRVVTLGPGGAVRGRFIFWRKSWQELVVGGKGRAFRAGDGQGQVRRGPFSSGQGSKHTLKCPSL